MAKRRVSESNKRPQPKVGKGAKCSSESVTAPTEQDIDNTLSIPEVYNSRPQDHPEYGAAYPPVIANGSRAVPPTDTLRMTTITSDPAAPIQLEISITPGPQDLQLTLLVDVIKGVVAGAVDEIQKEAEKDAERGTYPTTNFFCLQLLIMAIYMLQYRRKT